MDWPTSERLREINRQLSKLNRDFDERNRKSGKTSNECSSEHWYGDFMWAIIALEEEEKKLTSNSLEFEARRLWLPIPPRENTTRWEESMDKSHTRFLSPIGMTELRAAIRKEHSERRAIFEWWLKTLGGAVGILTGLIGALIGLVSVLRK